jgi:3-oxoacyl-[acyl-carrier protein] reductase
MTDIFNSSRFAVLGASRGLGAAIVSQLLQDQAKVFGVARKPSGANIQWCVADISQKDGQDKALKALEEFQPERVICCLGGGPYGAFAAKTWKSHQWALEVSLLFPAQLLHWALNSKVQQIVMVGSSVAEANSDPGAASYAASKHGLRGLLTTIKDENPAADVRLFSPGYMDTDMLPATAKARQLPVWSPAVVADDLLKWMKTGPRFDHRSLAIRPQGR